MKLRTLTPETIPSIVILVVFIVLFAMVFFMKGNYMKKTYEEIYARA